MVISSLVRRVSIWLSEMLTEDRTDRFWLSLPLSKHVVVINFHQFFILRMEIQEIDSEARRLMREQKERKFRQIWFFWDRSRASVRSCTNKSLPNHLFSNDHESEKAIFIVDLINGVYRRCISKRGGLRVACFSPRKENRKPRMRHTKRTAQRD